MAGSEGGDVAAPAMLKRGHGAGAGGSGVAALSMDLPEPPAPEAARLLSGEVEDGPGEPSTSARPALQVGMLAAFSGLAGFLFGFDTGNISGALPYIRDELLAGYAASSARLHWVEGFIVSAAVVGAALGSACGGSLSDRLGRKPALKLADCFFAIGALVMAAAPDAAVLILGRLLVGVGVGVASVTAPVYIAETAPTRVRATLVTVNTLMITSGQFVAYLLDWGFTFAPGTWRWMLGVAALPALVQAVGLGLLPESPRWLVAQGRLAEARQALSRLRKPGEATAELAEAAAAAAAAKRLPLRQALRAPEVRLELSVGVGLQVLQQAAGVNSVMYYTPSILSMAGISDNRVALLIAMGPAAVNAAGTVVGMLCIDRLGRRRLLLGSLAGVVAALLLLGGAFRLVEGRTPPVAASSCPAAGVATCAHCIQQGCSFCSQALQPQAAGTCVAAAGSCPAAAAAFRAGCPSAHLPLVVAGVVLYLAAFSPGLGPVPWSVNAEIFPVEVRGLASGAAATANWLTNAAVSQLFLGLAGLIGASGVFWLLAAIACCGAAWVHACLPETRGLSLEQVQALFVERAGCRSSTAPHPSDAQWRLSVWVWA